MAFRWAERILATLGIAALIALAVWLVCPKPPLLEEGAFSREVRDRDGRLLRLFPTPDGKLRIRCHLPEIAPELVEATQLYEDRYFGIHPGVNPWATAKAIWNELFGTGPRFGSSTITMQVARMRWRLQTRSATGKAMQMARAFQIERHYSKDEILEAYLNLAPYGGNVEGVGAAARVYFGCDPVALTLAQCLALATVPQNPAKRGPKPQVNPVLEAARRRLFQKWIGNHPEDVGMESMLEIPVRNAELPAMEAAHFCQRAVETVSRLRVDTTLDRDLQRLVERQVGSWLLGREADGLRNASVILVESESVMVRAYVGSADFGDVGIAGQVDGVRMLRSPGSALKPFVYALAMDEGLIHPASVVFDVPGGISGYDPGNFDRGFAGPLPAWQALVQSRNIPAVQLSKDLRRRTLHDLLRSCGVRRLPDANWTGLALALGGAEVSLEDLAELYAMLANGGQLRPIRMVAGAAHGGERVLSAESAWLTLDMLRKGGRPGAPSTSSDGVSWKTGTSHGYRDAWTAGVFDGFTLVVWLGNFDGSPNPALVGRGAAAPLFWKIAEALRARQPDSREERPEPPIDLNLERVDVCAVSGQMPGHHCEGRTATWFMPGISPIARCAVHQREGEEEWRSDAAAVLATAGVGRRSDSRAGAEPGSVGPRIISPRNGKVVRNRGAIEAEVALEAVARGELHWFCDGTYLGPSDPSVAMIRAFGPGEFELRAVDLNGRAATRRLLVE